MIDSLFTEKPNLRPVAQGMGRGTGGALTNKTNLNRSGVRNRPCVFSSEKEHQKARFCARKHGPKFSDATCSLVGTYLKSDTTSQRRGSTTYKKSVKRLPTRIAGRKAFSPVCLHRTVFQSGCRMKKRHEATKATTLCRIKL